LLWELGLNRKLYKFTGYIKVSLTDEVIRMNFRLGSGRRKRGISNPARVARIPTGKARSSKVNCSCSFKKISLKEVKK